MPTQQTAPGVWNINGYTVHFAGLAEAGEGTLSWEGWEFPVGGKIEGLTAQGANIYNAAVAGQAPSQMTNDK